MKRIIDWFLSLFKVKEKSFSNSYSKKIALITYNTTIDKRVYGNDGYLEGTKTDATNYKNLFDKLSIPTKVLGDKWSNTKNIISHITDIYDSIKYIVGRKLIILVVSKHGIQLKNIKDNDRDKKAEGIVNWDSVLLDDDINTLLNTVFDSTCDILVIYDTCYAGGMYNTSLNNEGVNKSLIINKQGLNYELPKLQESKGKPNIKWILSSKENETSKDLGEKKGGVFSYTFFKHFNINISYRECMQLIIKDLACQTPNIRNNKDSTFNDNQTMF